MKRRQDVKTTLAFGKVALEHILKAEADARARIAELDALCAKYSDEFLGKKGRVSVFNHPVELIAVVNSYHFGGDYLCHLGVQHPSLLVEYVPVVANCGAVCSPPGGFVDFPSVYDGKPVHYVAGIRDERR
ncbi:hypothetical protein HY639_02155 [Candidatus Woesearchaeota archaeon]|nr:hypothetical protein [Candidatus Woesearchaeota archaeon]